MELYARICCTQSVISVCVLKKFGGVCELMCPLCERNELPWAYLTFTPPPPLPPFAKLSLNLALLTPHFPQRVYLSRGRRRGKVARPSLRVFV